MYFFSFLEKKMQARPVSCVLPLASDLLVPGTPKAAFQLKPSLVLQAHGTTEGISIRGDYSFLF